MSQQVMHAATRSCVGCKSRDAQARMTRFTLQAGRLAWDRGRRLGGRGAYLHAESECVRAFLSHKPFFRSLRASVASADRARLVAELRAQ